MIKDESSPKHINLNMLLDTPEDNLGNDLLGFERYVNALYRIIDSPSTKGPFVMAINAPWGAGKSSLASMLQRRLESTPAMEGKYTHRVTWFNAWMHDDVDHLSSSFISHIAYTAHRKRSWIAQFSHPIPASLVPKSKQTTYRLSILIKMSLITCFLFGGIFYGIPYFASWIGVNINPLGFMNNIAQDLGIDVVIKPGLLGIIFILQLIIKKTVTTLTTLNAYIQSPSQEAKGGQLKKIRSELNKLINQATPRGSKFVVFVDDLERCRENGSIEVLESINQLLQSDKIIVVVLAELKWITRVVENKYQSIITDAEVNFGFNYIQKIIQLIFTLPTSSKINWEKFKQSFENRQKHTSIQLKNDFWSFFFLKSRFQLINIFLKVLDFIPALIRYSFYKIFFHNYNLSSVTITPQIIWANNLLIITILLFITALKTYSIVFATLFLLSCGISIWSLFTVFKTQSKKLKSGDLSFSKSVLSLWTKEGIKDQLQRENIEDSKEFITSLEVLMEYLKQVDLLTLRNVKRTTNRFRLMYFIFNYKEKAEIDGRILAKWVVLLEKWPNFVSFLRENGGDNFFQLKVDDYPRFDAKHPFAIGCNSLGFSLNELELIYAFCFNKESIEGYVTRLVNLEF